MTPNTTARQAGLIATMIDEWYFHADEHVKSKLADFSNVLLDRFAAHSADASNARQAGMTDERIFEIVGEVLGQPLIAEDLRGGFTVHTEPSDWVNFARALLAAPAAPAPTDLAPCIGQCGNAVLASGDRICHECREYAPAPAAQAATEPPLLGHWHGGNGVLCCGTMRIFGEDFDTDPTEEFKQEIMQWVCETLNAALRQQSATPAATVTDPLEGWTFERTNHPAWLVTEPDDEQWLSFPWSVEYRLVELVATSLFSAPADAPSDPLRAVVQAAVDLMEAREWAEHFAECHAPGDELASRLEACITDLHNEAYGGEDRADAASEADKRRLDRLHDEHWDLRSFCIGDDDVGWRIVEFHMAAPHERVVAEVFKDDPRAAIDAAMQVQRERQHGAQNGGADE